MKSSVAKMMLSQGALSKVSDMSTSSNDNEKVNSKPGWIKRNNEKEKKP